MSSLRVRLYDGRYGAAALISLPDRRAGGAEEMRQVLVDGGAAPGAGASGAGPIVEDVLAVLAGRPLDLHVTTNEHLDRVQGLCRAERLGKGVPVEYAWLPAFAAPDYERAHPEARRRRAAAAEAWKAIDQFVGAAPEPPAAGLRALLENNDPGESAACVAWLRSHARVRTSYVARGADLAGTHPFAEAVFRIWGPEEDCAPCPGALQPMALARLGATAGAGPGADKQPPRDPLPPPGVDAGAFYNLVQHRRDGLEDNLLGIDRAANDASVVFSIDWRGWRLLFGGDAEERSWRAMAAGGALAPVHFLTLRGHGAGRGAPPELLDRVLPVPAPDARPRWAGLSVPSARGDRAGEGAGAPEAAADAALRAALAPRCTVRTTAETPAGAWIDFELPG